MKYVRVILKDTDDVLHFPIDEGNSFVNLIIQWRTQGFALDATVNTYVPVDEIKWACQVELTDPVSGMTKQ